MGKCCGNVPRETSIADPVTVGAPNGAPPIRARVNLNAYGRRAFTVAWFTGAGVAAAVAGGTLTPVDG